MEYRVLMSARFYDANAASFIAATAEVDMSDLYAPFLSQIPNGGSILDAGSGSGRDALAFQRLGYNVNAFDASPTMVAATAALAGVPVRQATFETFVADTAYDGIWACASLLHVARRDLPDVLHRLADALAPAGVLYASFKYGDAERIHQGRFFDDLDEAALAGIVSRVATLDLARVWITQDRRPGRSDECWLNSLLCRKAKADTGTDLR